MIDLELYRIFKIVADEGNITRASEILNISQPAVTKHIHNLEEQLGVKLFKREKYGMGLTEDGKKIYEQINNSIDTLVGVENNIFNPKIINFGVQVNIPNKIYDDIISKIKTNSNSSEINIIKSYTENMISMLNKQEIDLFVSKRINDIDDSIVFIPIGKLHDNFFVKVDSEYNSLNDINNNVVYTLRNLSTTSINLGIIINEKNYNTVIKNITFSSILEIIKDDDIISFITEEYIQNDIDENRIRKLDESFESVEVEYGIYYNKNNKIKNIEYLISEE